MSITIKLLLGSTGELPGETSFTIGQAYKCYHIPLEINIAQK